MNRGWGRESSDDEALASFLRQHVIRFGAKDDSWSADHLKHCCYGACLGGLGRCRPTQSLALEKLSPTRLHTRTPRWLSREQLAPTPPFVHPTSNLESLKATLGLDYLSHTVSGHFHERQRPSHLCDEYHSSAVWRERQLCFPIKVQMKGIKANAICRIIQT